VSHHWEHPLTRDHLRLRQLTHHQSIYHRSFIVANVIVQYEFCKQTCVAIGARALSIDFVCTKCRSKALMSSIFIRQRIFHPVYNIRYICCLHSHRRFSRVQILATVCDACAHLQMKCHAEKFWKMKSRLTNFRKVALPSITLVVVGTR